MGLFEFTHGSKRWILQNELGLYARSMKPMSKLICNYKIEKKRKKKEAIELVYLLQISNLGTRKTIKKNDWSHFMLCDLISQILQVPKGKNFSEKLDKADLVD